MRLPKSINIAGKQYEIRLSSGAGGCFYDNKIEIGKDSKGDTRDQIILHEIVESILTERLLRYTLPHTPKENGDLLFCFNHLDFERIFIPDLLIALKPFLKK